MGNQVDMRTEGIARNKALFSLMRAFGYVLAGRLHWRRERIGEVITTEGGQKYTVFRQITVDPRRGDSAGSGAILRIRFSFARGSSKQNQMLSLIPIPFIVGFPGFRSKTWALDEESGGFQGIYEWDTKQDADMYRRAFAIKLMTKRAVPESISFDIVP